MKRETKVGLVVAGSFIVLVGIVVASKMRGGIEVPGNEVAQTVTPGGEESETPEKKSSGKDEPKAIVPPRPFPEDLRPVGATEPVSKGSDLPLLPPFPGLPAPTTPPGLPPISAEDQKRALDALRLAKEPTPPPGLPALPGLPKNSELPPPGLPEKFAFAKDTLPPLPAVPSPMDLTPKKDDLPALPPLPPPGADLPPVPAPAIPKKEASLPPPVFPTAEPRKQDPLPALPVPKDTPPPVFPAPGRIDVSPVAPPMPKKELAPVFVPPLDPGPFEKKSVAPPVGIAPPLPEVKDRTPAPLPPLGSEFKNPPSVGIAPPVPTTPTTLPKVTTVDIPPYVLRPDDKDFASVSQRIYGSDRYAQALLAFNRDHPLSKDDIRSTPPRLVTGQMLYIPPREMLEAKYASLLLPEGRPVIGATGGPDVAPVKIGAIGPPPIGTAPLSPPPVGIKTATPGSPVSLGAIGPATGSPTRSEATKSFVVSGTGLHIIQVAQQTLGDSRRWPEIYRLNPGIQPQNLIPSGTELKLPVDARVP